MQLTPKGGIILTVIALILCTVQAGICASSAAHTTSQTDEQNKEARHPPTEIPGVAGTVLLAVTGVLLSFPREEAPE